MDKVYKYKVIREYMDGTCGKRTKTYWSFERELRVGGIYAHLGSGFPGLHRVISMKIVEI